jgi:hypothetical protein
MLRWIFVVGCLTLGACSGAGPQSGGNENVSTVSQAITQVTGATPFLMVLCTASDNTYVPPSNSVDYYNSLMWSYLRLYWQHESYDALDLSGSVVTPFWTPTNITTAQLLDPNYDALRITNCVNAVAGSYNLDSFYSFIAVYNTSALAYETVASVGSRVIPAVSLGVYAPPSAIAHEMGHVFSLPHSHGTGDGPGCGLPNGEACDKYDLMSYPFHIPGAQPYYYQTIWCVPGFGPDQHGCNGGPGIDVWYRQALGWITLPTLTARSYTTYFWGELASRQHRNGNLPMGLIIQSPCGLVTYTAEWVRRYGNDTGTPDNALVVHRIIGEIPFFVETAGGEQFDTNTPFSDPANGIDAINLYSINGDLYADPGPTGTVYVQMRSEVWGPSGCTIGP